MPDLKIVIIRADGTQTEYTGASVHITAEDGGTVKVDVQDNFFGLDMPPDRLLHEVVAQLKLLGNTNAFRCINRIIRMSEHRRDESPSTLYELLEIIKRFGPGAFPHNGKTTGEALLYLINYERVPSKYFEKCGLKSQLIEAGLRFIK